MAEDPLVNPAFVRTMAKYNAEMNRRLYGAAANIPDAERRVDRGAFWGSIHGTLNHLLWGDQQWMSRFDGCAKPVVALKQSATLIDDFEALREARADADALISDWAQRVDDAWLAADTTWFSGAAQRELTTPSSLLVVHFFNHQTHHRGQAHALITAAGQETGDTDLFMVIRQAV
jgi:uncharacterized damage-inducible protein DinB